MLVHQSPCVTVLLLNISDNIHIHNPTNQRDFVKKLGCVEKMKHLLSHQNGLVAQMIDKDYSALVVAAILSSVEIWANI